MSQQDQQPLAATPPKEAAQVPQVAPSPLDRFDAARDRCVKMFGSEVRFMEEATFLLAAVNNTPALQECTPASINGVLLSIASTGLSLNPVLRLCYVIPRNIKVKTAGGEKWEKRAQVEPSYMGLMKLATDSGAVRSFEVHEVWGGDDFEFDLVNKRPVRHKPYWTIGQQRGKLIGVYGFATLADGSVIPEHMGADELAKIQSKSDNRGGAIFTDWQGEMARKSLVKRLQKYLPRTEQAVKFLEAVELDNQGIDLARPSDPNAALAARVDELRSKARELFKDYKGEDKGALKQKAAAEALSGKQNPEFWEELILMLQPETAQA